MRILRDERIARQSLSTTDLAVQVRVRKVEDTQNAVTALQQLVVPISNSILGGVSAYETELTSTDDGLITLTLTSDGLDLRLRSAVSQSIEVIRRRVDELGTTEPLIQRQGVDRILVQVPGLQDPERLKRLLQETAKLTFQLVDVSMTAEDARISGVPLGSEILPSIDDQGPAEYLVQKRVMVSGEELVDAQPSFDQQTNEPIVTFRFNTSGARKFGEVTAANVNLPFAIVLDNEVISAPVIRQPILGGSGQISGGFTVEAARDLSILLRAGALPADLTIIEERTVGPGLGADSIEAGRIATIIGALAVLAFMILAYRQLGIIANIALISNVLIVMGLLSILGATLTLPGIAGIVLTIGMAVDANVLIYERIAEEGRAGRSPLAAIDAGFSRALTTILDANITTLIAAVILIFVGTGPVRGFAITLGIGIFSTTWFFQKDPLFIRMTTIMQ